MDITPLYMLLGFFSIALLCRLPTWLEELRAKTPDRKATIVHDRLIDRFRREKHPNPYMATSDHLSMMTDLELFRRHACAAYVRTGKPLDEIKEEWLAERSAGVQWAKSIGRSKADGIRYAKTLKIAVMDMPEDEVLIYGDAPAKLAKENHEIKARIDALITARKRDPVYDHVIETAFAGRNSI